MKKFRRRDVILVGFFLLVAIVCASMGIWQLDRLQQRRARNAELESRLALPVTTFPPGQAIQEPSFRAYTVTGEFDPLHAILLKNQPLDEQAGYHLLVPLLFEDGTPALLVDRGWLPNDLGLQNEPAILAAQLTGIATVTGVLLPSQEQPAMSILGDQIPATGEPPLLAWRLVDLEGIARQLPYDLYPLYLAQTGPPVQSGGFPIPTFEPDLSDGPHVSYAIQWFAFAAISLVGGAALLRRQRASEGLD